MDIIEKAIEYISNLFAGDAGGHDVGHTIRVYNNALTIAKHCPEADCRIVALAALLHDADDHKLFNTKNNLNARAFLTGQNVSPEKIEAIITAINSVSFSQNRGKRPNTLEGMIVQDADRLDAIGAIGIARCFAYGGEHGRSLDMSIQHFYDKLLLLKDEMNTDAAKRMAVERHAFMAEFLEHYKQETNAGEGK